jgi:hypothetical protein
MKVYSKSLINSCENLMKVDENPSPNYPMKKCTGPKWPHFL